AAVLGHRDAALGGDAAGLLVGLGEALLAQPFGGRVDFALVLGERLLALHHAGAGTVAQVLDQLCGDFHGVLDDRSGARGRRTFVNAAGARAGAARTFRGAPEARTGAGNLPTPSARACTHAMARRGRLRGPRKRLLGGRSLAFVPRAARRGATAAC